MRKIVLYENTSSDIGQHDIGLLSTLLEMSNEIKSSLGLPYQPIQFDSSSKLRIERIIGNISLNDVNLVILPKVLIYSKLPEDQHDILKSFFKRTIKSAGEKLGSTVFFTKNSVVDDQDLLTEVLAQYYYESLAKAVRLSAISTYEAIEQKSTSVKGRILVRKQLSEPLSDAKIWCRYKKISTENSYNALLVWACKFFIASIKDVALKKKFSQIVQEIGGQEEELSIQIVTSLRLPRQFSIYKESFSIARTLFLKHFGKREEGTGSHVCGYVISTERAFERIVEAYSKSVALSMGYGHRAQATSQLASSSDGKDYDYNIIPDDLVFSNGSRLILDAKYKLLNYDGTRNKPLREDLYQMISSCIAQKAHEAILVYPIAYGAKPMSWKVLEKVNGHNYLIHSAFIDAFGTDESIRESMVQLLKNTAFYGVKA